MDKIFARGRYFSILIGENVKRRSPGSFKVNHNFAFIGEVPGFNTLPPEITQFRILKNKPTR